MCEGDNLNRAVALLWAGNQGERAGVVTVPASAVCVCVCLKLVLVLSCFFCQLEKTEIETPNPPSNELQSKQSDICGLYRKPVTHNRAVSHLAACCIMNSTKSSVKNRKAILKPPNQMSVEDHENRGQGAICWATTQQHTTTLQ